MRYSMSSVVSASRLRLRARSECAKRARSRKRRARAGFTLLEVLLSTAIGVLLMGGLYIAMSVSLHQAQAGRDVVEHSLLVRTLLQRMANDIRLNIVSPMPANSVSSSSGGSGGGGSSSAAGGSGGSGSASGGMGLSSGGSSSMTTGATSSSTGTTSSTTTTTSTTTVTYLGVQGQTNQLTIFTSRLPSDVINSYWNPATSANPMVGSDLRRIDYWLGNDNNGSGLCRKEFNPATGTDAMDLTLADPNSDSMLKVAEEVRSLQFRYWDGTTWQDTWDSTQPSTLTGSDGVTPQGPPVAIEITISIPDPGVDPDKATEQQLKQYRHVVTIPATNGTSIQGQVTLNPDGSSSTSTTTTTGN